MSVVPPDTSGPWTIDDLRAMPDTPARVELVDGSLVVTPPPSSTHQYILAVLSSTLRNQLGVDRIVVENLGIDLGASLRIPDLLVFRPGGFLGGQLEIDPSALTLVVEVVSPSSRSQDRLVKPAQYAAAGIEGFWRIETDPISLTAHVLRGEVYAELGTWSSGQLAEIGQPLGVSIDVGALIPPGA